MKIFRMLKASRNGYKEVSFYFSFGKQTIYLYTFRLKILVIIDWRFSYRNLYLAIITFGI